MNKVQMTQKGYDKLLQDLEHLKTVRRDEISEYMGSAIADGDLRESAAYDEARLMQSENEATISQLEDQLTRAEIVAERHDGAVGLGSRVRVRTARGEQDFELVGSYETDVLKGRISDQSPFGQALMGARAGDTVRVQLPRGEQVFEVLNVR